MSLPVLLAAWPAWLTEALPWAALGLTTLVLIAVLRTRWKRTPVLTRCIIFSIYAHLFFATAAYTTNYMGWRPGEPGSGSGMRTVRVRMTTEASFDEATMPDVPVPEEPESSIVVDEAPPELTPAEAQLTSKQDTTSQSPPDQPQPEPPRPQIESPPDRPPVALPEKTPASSPLEAVAEVLADVAPRYASSVPADIEPKQQHDSPATIRRTEPGARRTAASQQNAAMPDLYRLRFAEDRAGVVESAGGNPDTEAAVKSALLWLVANQEPDGHWSAGRHGAGQGSIQGQNRGDTGVDADTGITGLALLALLGAGHTHLEGEHRVAIQHGLEYLLSSQRADGSLAGNAKLFSSMYCHGMATLALAEALAITGDVRLRAGVEKAVAYTVAAQHIGGGWRYQPGDVGDTSQFGWQIMALKSAELAGVKTPEITKQRSLRFLETVSSGRHGGLASYRAKERPSRTMTAEALLCHYLLADSPRQETCEEAAAFISQELPTSGAANVYYWYYGTLALRFSGNSAWQRWNEGLQQQLLESQRGDAKLAGSWDPDKLWGGYGGRVYQTSLSALCLESYYRYDKTVLMTSPNQHRR